MTNERRLADAADAVHYHSALVSLEDGVAAGSFRPDMCYRLNVVRLRVPPLRERREDVAQLFATFIEEAKAQLGRGDFASFAEARKEANDMRDKHIATYLKGTPKLGVYLEEGLAQMGYSLEDFGKNRL